MPTKMSLIDRGSTLLSLPAQYIETLPSTVASLATHQSDKSSHFETSVFRFRAIVLFSFTDVRIFEFSLAITHHYTRTYV